MYSHKFKVFAKIVYPVQIITSEVTFTSCHDSLKNMAARGGGGWGGCLFSLYTYIENVKNLLVRHHWTDFNITDCSSRYNFLKNVATSG